MKKGNWNYTEDIMWRVVFIKLLPVSEPKAHWQNALAGQKVQAIEVSYPKQAPFLIFNDDGTGHYKVTHGGGPNLPHRSIDKHEFISEVPESQVMEYDPIIETWINSICDDWCKANHPDVWERLKALKEGLKKLHKDNPKAFPKQQ